MRVTRTATGPSRRTFSLNALPDPEMIASLAAFQPQPVLELADIDPATAGTLSALLRPVLSVSSLLMIVRIVMTWYPEIDATKLPWSIAYTPTGENGRRRERSGLQDGRGPSNRASLP